MANYDVILHNTLNGSFEESEARQQLAAKFKLNSDKLDKLLSNASTTIKRNLEETQAQRFKSIIESCGFQATLKSLDSPTMFELEAVEAAEESKSATPEKPHDVYDAPSAPVGVTVFCRHCGKNIEETATECVHCGKTVYTTTGRSKVVAGFLAFFMGGFGFHRFYLKQWWGVFYIPFGIFGISAIVTLIEAIYFWVCPQDRWQRKYGHLPPSNVWVWVALCIIPFVAVIGILAAIALPAYQDYTIRAKVSQGLMSSQMYVDQVEEFILESNFVPNSSLDANLNYQPGAPYIKSIEIVEGGGVVVEFDQLELLDEPQTIIYEPLIKSENRTITSITWDCTGGSLPSRYRPSKCRPIDF
ncbi:TM2 domain-containing protein [Alteromonadaceae bacterium 2753L.S.0a.02]|nr:TM2 domain-containing protein [Alteromonadaceae bacterium 2753L.S.0a.02]